MSQSYSLTLVQGHSDSTFQIYFFLQTAWLIETKFYVAPPWDGWMIDCASGPGYMTSMSSMSIYGKNFKNILLWKQKADDLESWYVALGTLVLPSLFKWWPGLTYLAATSNLVLYAFVWEKGKTVDFSETIVVCDHKVNRCSQLNEYMKLYEYQRSRSFTDLGPNLSYSIF